MRRDLITDFFSRKIEFKGVKRDLEIEEIENKIVSIIGPRRAGKTYFFYYLYTKLFKPMYVNFEDIAFRNIKAEEFFEIVKIFSENFYEPKTLLLDEIQIIEGWQVLLRSLLERKFKVIVTGSSSKLLSKEISTELRGRTIKYLLFPFSFKEFLRAKNFETKDLTFEKTGTLLKFLKEYLEFGGFPEVVLNVSKEKILREYFDETFYKDFVERHKIKSIEFGKFLFEFAFQNFSKEISFKKILDFFHRKVSFRTLYDYIEKLSDTLNVFFLDKYSQSIYERSSWPKKMYVCDVGISTALRFFSDIGKRMENTVFLELKRSENEKPFQQILYFKNSQGNEVDFVIKEGKKIKQLIQVTYVSDKKEVEEKEIKNLIKAGDLLKCKNLLIITWDYEDEISVNSKKIKFVPMWKWLLKAK
ncbi:MAG: ATP-binding protein [Candidatus Aenigmatarchaeota archaeon]